MMPAKAKKWCFPRPCEEIKDLISRELKVSSALAEVLVNRGIEDINDARSFLNPSMEDLLDPFLMKDMEAAVKKIISALDNDEKIMVYGDYDADGITASALLTSALKRMGGDAAFFLPSRFTEGYGLQSGALKKFAEDGYKLIVTVDCGINAVDEVAFCRELGMELIITDHHVPSAPEMNEVCNAGGTEEAAVPVINPMQNDCEYPFRDLSGVGVAYKLLCAILQRTDYDIDPTDYLDLVALGTVADIVSLTGENRILTHYGLKKMNRDPSLGLRTIIDVVFPEQLNGSSFNKVKGSSVSGKGDSDSCVELERETFVGSRDVSYRIAPIINAAGRMGEAYPAAELLMSEDFEEAKGLTELLITNNNTRRDIENAVFEEARQMVENYYQNEPDTIIVLAQENWHYGVIGIVASKLMRIYGVPIALISVEGDNGKGSARSVQGFNITEALGKCSHLLQRFGGHNQAAGFSLHKKDIDDFRKVMGAVWKERPHPDDSVPRINIDADLAPHEITIDFAEKLEILEPHGAGNPKPVFLLRGWKLEDSRLVGRDKSHLKLSFSKRERVIAPIYFRAPEEARAFRSGTVTDIAVYLNRGIWQDRPVLNIEVQDMVEENREGGSGKFPLIVFDHRNKGVSEAGRGSRNSFSQQQLNKINVLKGLCRNGAETIIYIGSDSERLMLSEKLPGVDNIKFIHPRNLNGAGSNGGENGGRADGGNGGLGGGGSDLILRQLVFYHLPVLPVFLRGALDVSGFGNGGAFNNGNIRIYLLYQNEDRIFNDRMMEAATPKLTEAEEIFRRLEDEGGFGGKGSGEDGGLFSGMAEIKRKRIIDIFREANLVGVEDDKVQLLNGRPGFEINLLRETDTYKRLQETKKESVSFQDFMLKATVDQLTEYMVIGSGIEIN